MSGCWFRGRCRRLKAVVVALAVIAAIAHTMTQPVTQPVTPVDQSSPPPHARATTTALASASAASASARHRDDAYDRDDAAVDRRAADDDPYIVDRVGDLDQFGALGAVGGQARDPSAAHHDRARPRGAESRGDEHAHQHDLSRKANARFQPTGFLANAASSNVGAASASSIDGGAGGMRNNAPAPLAKSSVSPRQLDLLRQPCGSGGGCGDDTLRLQAWTVRRIGLHPG